MTELLVMPDIIDGLQAWLSDQPELADLDDPKVVTQLPAAKVWPIVRLTQFNDAPITQTPMWFGRTWVQVDVFGGSTKTAQTIARTIRALLSSRFTGTDDYSANDVNVSGLRDEPDTTFDPVKPRWLFVAEFFTRPRLSPGS